MSTAAAAQPQAVPAAAWYELVAEASVAGISASSCVASPARGGPHCAVAIGGLCACHDHICQLSDLSRADRPEQMRHFYHRQVGIAVQTRVSRGHHAAARLAASGGSATHLQQQATAEESSP